MAAAVHLLLATIVVIYRGTLGADPQTNWYSSAYGKEHDWSSDYPACKGNKQSPIHIESNRATYNSRLGNFNFEGYNTTKSTLLLQNNGHSATVSIGGTKPTVSGAGLGHTYRLQQIHFHWGKDDTRGSEHLLDKETLAGEVHFVHFRDDLNKTSVYKHPNGFAVLGVLLKAGGKKHPGYQKILDSLNKVIKTDDQVKLDSFALRELLPADTQKFFRYNGSLTTPPCAETVVWTVFASFVALSNDQMAQLRRLKSKDGDKLLDTYRPIQPTNNRTVYSSWHSQGNHTSDGDRISTSCISYLRGIGVLIAILYTLQ